MKAVIDIGSNTIVLVTYDIIDNKPIIKETFSYPAHLIDYVNNKIMNKEGIDLAKKVLEDYKEICLEQDIEDIYCDITEPCRIDNQEELVSSLKETGIKIYPLTGEEEASLDFRGAKLCFEDIHDGIAFDVGGGSTELISFKNDDILAAISFHLGCVRLSHYPLDTEICKEELERVRRDNTELDITCETIIGIGGTVRAISKLHKELYGSKNIINVTNLEDMFKRLVNKEEIATKVMEDNVNKERQKVLLPGMHMVLEIAHIYNAKEILVSKTGIREGFLLHCLEN